MERCDASADLSMCNLLSQQQCRSGEQTLQNRLYVSSTLRLASKRIIIGAFGVDFGLFSPIS